MQMIFNTEYPPDHIFNHVGILKPDISTLYCIPDRSYMRNHLPGALVFIMLILFSGIRSYAQEVEFSASAPPVVAVGEQFRLTYSLNNRGSDLRLPDLGKFQLVSGPSTSSSSSVQVINGQMTQTQSTTYTYILRATETGEFTIGPASITVDSESYNSNPLSIEVVPDQEGRSAVPGQTQTPGTATRPGDLSAADIFVRIHIDKNEVYQGEAIVATIKLYTKLDLTGIENVRFPAFSGFYQQDIEVPPLRTLSREVIDGEIFGTGVLKQLILFPQRSGKINLGTFEMDAMVRERAGRRGSMFDDFFGGFETRRIPVQSTPVEITVKPLPGPRPSVFNGAVGEYTMNVDLNDSEIRTNEAVSLRVTVSGRGNLKLLGQPGIDFPPGFEVYDPSVRENITNGTEGQRGSITWEYLMIPRNEGNFRIPPVQFAYFNPSSGSYNTLSSGEINLAVLRGEDLETVPSVAGYSREDIRILGSDIRFIKTGGVVLHRIGHDPFGNFRFYLWFIFPLLVFAILVIIQRKKIRDRANIALMKNRRASKMARSRLKNAGRLLKVNKNQQFYEEVLKACWGYLSDKLLIPVSGLNRENARSALLEKMVGEDSVNKMMDVIELCEYARYAPASSAGDMDRIYGDTINIITEIEQKIKK